MKKPLAVAGDNNSKPAVPELIALFPMKVRSASVFVLVCEYERRTAPA